MYSCIIYMHHYCRAERKYIVVNERHHRMLQFIECARYHSHVTNRIAAIFSFYGGGGRGGAPVVLSSNEEHSGHM